MHREEGRRPRASSPSCAALCDIPRAPLDPPRRLGVRAPFGALRGRRLPPLERLRASRPARRPLHPPLPACILIHRRSPSSGVRKVRRRPTRSHAPPTLLACTSRALYACRTRRRVACRPHRAPALWRPAAQCMRRHHDWQAACSSSSLLPALTTLPSVLTACRELNARGVSRPWLVTAVVPTTTAH